MQTAPWKDEGGRILSTLGTSVSNSYASYIQFPGATLFRNGIPEQVHIFAQEISLI